MRIPVLSVFMAASVAFAPAPARACDLALALAVDVSGSVDPREFQVQMLGLADALRDPVISEALVRAEAQLLLLQWTGSSRQRVTIPWTQATDFEALDRFADKVETDQRIWRNYSTAIGEALQVTAGQFSSVSACARHMIDLSGDGYSNEGIDPREVQADLRAKQITVNAIAIEESEADLTEYFFENVITGSGAFVETANSFDDYPERIRRKLLREVTLQSAGIERPIASNRYAP